MNIWQKLELMDMKIAIKHLYNFICKMKSRSEKSVHGSVDALAMCMHLDKDHTKGNNQG